MYCYYVKYFDQWLTFSAVINIIRFVLFSTTVLVLIDIDKNNYSFSQLHVGTGSDHVPFELQVDVFEPYSVKPGSQTNVAFEPAIGRLSMFVDVPPVTVPFVKLAIAIQVAKREESNVQIKFVNQQQPYRCMV